MAFKGGYVPGATEALLALAKVATAEADAKAAKTEAAAAASRASAAMTKANGADSKAVDAQAEIARTGTALANLQEVAAKFDSEIAKADLIHTTETTERKAADKALSDRLLLVESRTLTVKTKQFRTTLAVAINGNATGTVAFPTPFPDANWKPALITNVAIDESTLQWTNQTAAGVTFTVKYAGALALAIGSIFTVEGVRNA